MASPALTKDDMIRILKTQIQEETKAMKPLLALIQGIHKVKAERVFSRFIDIQRSLQDKSNDILRRITDFIGVLKSNNEITEELKNQYYALYHESLNNFNTINGVRTNLYDQIILFNEDVKNNKEKSKETTPAPEANPVVSNNTETNVPAPEAKPVEFNDTVTNVSDNPSKETTPSPEVNPLVSRNTASSLPAKTNDEITPNKENNTSRNTKINPPNKPPKPKTKKPSKQGKTVTFSSQPAAVAATSRSPGAAPAGPPSYGFINTIVYKAPPPITPINMQTCSEISKINSTLNNKYRMPSQIPYVTEVKPFDHIQNQKGGKKNTKKHIKNTINTTSTTKNKKNKKTIRRRKY
jgi:hypothetical protein